MTAITANQPSEIRLDPKAISLFSIILIALIGFMYLKNSPEVFTGSISIIKSSSDEDIDWDALTVEELGALEIELEKALRNAQNGLPLTPKEMERMQEIYQGLIERGGKAGGVLSRVINLTKNIVIASGTMEMQLEHLQNAKSNTDEGIQGVGQR